MNKERLKEIERQLDRAEIKRENLDIYDFQNILEHQFLNGNLTWLVKYVKEQAERVQELEELVEGYKIELMIKDNAKKRAKQRSKHYREALKRIRLNVKICGNEEYFPKVIEEIISEALDGEGNA